MVPDNDNQAETRTLIRLIFLDICTSPTLSDKLQFVEPSSESNQESSTN